MYYFKFNFKDICQSCFLVVSLGLIILPIAYSTILSLFSKNVEINNLKNKNIGPTRICINDVYIYKCNTRELQVEDIN